MQFYLNNMQYANMAQSVIFVCPLSCMRHSYTGSQLGKRRFTFDTEEQTPLVSNSTDT